jgi:uncharacterized protein
MRKEERTNFYSWKIRTLSKGCSLCVKGRKLVLYITGLCSRNCYYCPLSDQRKNKDKIWANERLITTKQEMIEEALISKATGAGITGGDPLIRLERTVDYAKALKKKFGKNFHIHIYLTLNLVNESRLRKLFNAGIDEVRFHPDFDNEKEWNRIFLAKKFKWKIGVEIPVIPGKENETKKLIYFIDNKIDFLNLNELEVSDTNANKLIKMGFTTKNRVSYGIKGSQELARKLLKYCLKKKIKAHYCTGRLKDRVQLGNRIRLRAESVRKKYDAVTYEGILVRGAIYLNELVPGFDYKKKIEKTKSNKEENNKIIKKLQKLKEQIKIKYEIKDELIDIDLKKFRILIAPWILEKICNNMKKKCAIVNEYPTYDNMEVEVFFLN